MDLVSPKGKVFINFSGLICGVISINFGETCAEYGSVGYTRKKKKKRSVLKNIPSLVSTENEG